MSLKNNLLLLITLLFLFSCSPATKKISPNIIFIMSDDHAFKAISAYDSALIKTPNIDRLAKEGIRFDRCFCTNAICAPSRAVILTGKYSHLNGVLDNSRPFDGEQQTLPKLLQQAGYQTAMIGKWHLKSDPTGFDEWLVLPGQGSYYQPAFRGPEGDTVIDGYVTDIITDKSIDFIENRDPDKPFYLMLHHKAPHRNWQPAIRHLNIYDGKQFPLPSNLHDTYTGKSAASFEQEMSISRHMSLDYDLKMPDSLIVKKDMEQELLFFMGDEKLKERMGDENFTQWEAYYRARASEYNSLPAVPDVLDEWKYRQYMEDYLACIHTVDENIGRLLDYLQESGLDKNTIVIYTSDQGFFLGEHGWYDKRFMYEEALRMPLLIRSPFASRSVDRHMVTNADFAPTILEMAGLEVPADMQGESFSDILEGEDPEDWRDAVYYHYFEYPAVHAVKRHYGIRTERYKLIHFYYDIDAWELYDLEEDPEEMINLINDTAYASVMYELKDRLMELQKVYADTTLEKYLPVRPEVISHLAREIPYTLKYEPSPRYPGTQDCLTDGIAYPEGEAYQIGMKDWCGFSGDDLVLDLDLGEEHEIKSIRAGFLQNQQDWIFAPVTVEFLTSLDGKEYMSITSDMCAESEKDDRIMKMYAMADYPGLKTRYIRVKAANCKLPDWHPGKGRPAWLFVDEIVVE